MKKIILILLSIFTFKLNCSQDSKMPLQDLKLPWHQKDSKSIQDVQQLAIEANELLNLLLKRICEEYYRFFNPYANNKEQDPSLIIIDVNKIDLVAISSLINNVLSDKDLLKKIRIIFIRSEKNVSLMLAKNAVRLAKYRLLNSKLSVFWTHDLALRVKIERAGFFFRPLMVSRNRMICDGCCKKLLKKSGEGEGYNVYFAKENPYYEHETCNCDFLIKQLQTDSSVFNQLPLLQIFKLKLNTKSQENFHNLLRIKVLNETFNNLVTNVLINIICDYCIESNTESGMSKELEDQQKICGNFIKAVALINHGWLLLANYMENPKEFIKKDFYNNIERQLEYLNIFLSQTSKIFNIIFNYISDEIDEKIAREYKEFC